MSVLSNTEWNTSTRDTKATGFCSGALIKNKQKPEKEKQVYKSAPSGGSSEPPEIGGDTRIYCIVDLIEPGKYEIVISMDRLGVRKATKCIRLAASASEAAMGELIKALHRLKHRNPHSVEVRCNVKQLVDAWRAPRLGFLLLGPRFAPGHMVSQFWDVVQKVQPFRLEDVTPDQYETAGLARSQTRHLDPVPRPFGVSESSGTQREDVEQ